MGQWVRWAERALIWGPAEEASISVTREGLLVSVIIWWLNASTQSRVWRGTQTAYWWWLVQKQNHWLQPHGGWCWHFHPISTAYRHQRKRNFETCLHGEKEEEKPRGETRESVQSPFLINRRAASKILYKHEQRERHSNTHCAHTHIYRHTFWLTGTHINISAEQKLHFLPSFTSCILNIIFQRKSLNVSSLLGAERSYLDYRLQAITKNWILSLIAVSCSAGAKETKRRQWRDQDEKNDMYGHHFSCGIELELMVSI